MTDLRSYLGAQNFAPVLQDLSAFLVERRLTTEAVAHSAWHASAVSDAKAGIEVLAQQGVIAAGQIDVLLRSFGAQQVQRLHALLDAACKRGLIDPSIAPQVLAGFEATWATTTPAEFVVGHQLLTAAQFNELRAAQTWL